MSASQHIQAVYSHSHRPIFDFALVNSAPVSAVMKERYAEEHADQVECDTPAIEALGVKCITGNFIEEGDFARHATGRLCLELLRLAQIPRETDSRTVLK
jgi:2-phospho-L-lactate transferase/gluconeogenesis factor (CofD/UPF0052 family)